jgi:hypothetical protein
MNATEVPVPRGVTAFAGHLSADTGATAKVEHMGGRRWRVSVQNDRVQMWVEYEARSHGRLDWRRSELFIDGQSVKCADSYADFLNLFADPDDRKPPPFPAPIEVDASSAPPLVRRVYYSVATVVKTQEGFGLTILRAGRRWAIEVSGDQLLMRVNFVTPLIDPARPMREPVTRLLRSQAITLVLNGVDRTGEIDGRLDRAFRLIQAHKASPTPAPITEASTAQVQSTGVTVRQQKVMRL